MSLSELIRKYAKISALKTRISVHQFVYSFDPHGFHDSCLDERLEERDRSFSYGWLAKRYLELSEVYTDLGKLKKATDSAKLANQYAERAKNLAG